MKRDIILHLPVFLAVARHKSFAIAASELGLSASAVSHAVRYIEDRINIALFSRTTRSVHLTEAGVKFLDAIGPAFAEIEQGIEQIKSDKGVISGSLKINSPRIAIPMAITPILRELSWQHPELTVEVTIDDGLADIVGSGYDAGIRLGEMIAQDMIAVRLTPPFKNILVASPDYLAAKGTPAALKDLQNHNCINYRLIASRSIYAWDVKDNTHDVKVFVPGNVLITDPTCAAEFALAGIGIAYVNEPLVRQSLRKGELVWLLPEASMQEDGLFLYFPQRIAQTPKLRAFIDVAKEVLKASH